MRKINFLNILVLGIVLASLFSFSLILKTTNNAVSGSALTGEAIQSGDLRGLELSVVVPEKYQRVNAGDSLQFQVSIKNIQTTGRYDIQLDYFIKKNEIVVANRRELKAIETQASFLSSITVPEETLPGIYNIEVQVNEEESAVATFYIQSNELGQIRTYLIILIVAIVVVGVMISWQLHRLANKKR